MTSIKCTCCGSELNLSWMTIPERAELIKKVVAEHYGINASEMEATSKGKGRTAEHVAIPRFIAMYLIRHLTGMSQFNISSMFGRDRSTVAHAEILIRDEMEVESPDGRTASFLYDQLKAVLESHVIQVQAA